VDGKARKEFAAVEIILRKAGEPESRLHFVALLHKVAALVDFPEKQPDGNVLGHIAFNARELLRILVNPDETMHLEKNGSEAGSRFERGVRRHFIFGEFKAAALLVGHELEQKCIARRVDQVVALFLPLRIFFQGLTLRAVVVHD
jgi:hypothetical protein